MDLNFILWFQSSASPLLDQFWGLMTQLGSEEFFMLFLPIVFWCVDKLIGIRFYLLFLLSIYCNDVAKAFFPTPRPYEVAPAVHPKLIETGGGYAFPSGHTQNTAVIWGYLAAQFCKPWLIALAILMIPLVGLSRIYLGLHWPVDVLGGFLIGLAFVIGGLAVYRFWDARSMSIPLLGEIAAAIVVPLVLFALFGTDTTARVCGVALGGALGYVLERRYVGFVPQAALWQQAVKVVLGVAVVFALRLTIKPLLPDVLLAHLVRYALIGLWVTLAAPFVFKLTRLQR
jgi:membrane-associated phospholipid phosphatase